MKEFFEKLKAKLVGGGVWILFIIIILVIVVPYVILIVVLRKQGKTLTLTPTISVVEISNNNPVDMNMAADAIANGKSLLEKLNKIKG